jgi:DNA-binding transcriptional MerR regulator
MHFPQSENMKAFIRVIYSSEGKSPAEVYQIMKGMGFHKMKGQPMFEGDVSDDAQLNEKMEDLHVALRGMELRYIPTLGSPTDQQGNLVCNARDTLNSWKALGLNVAELGQLLEIDVQKFRHQAIHALKAQVEQVVAARESELAEEKKVMAKAENEKVDREKAERSAATLRSLLSQEGGITFHQLHAGSGLEADELSEMLREMVDSGAVRAEQRGRRVVYSSA